MPEASHIPDRLQATLGLDEPVSRVRLVSPARAKALEKLGIRTVRGLITHFPRRYIDLSARETAASARIGESCTIEGVIHDVKLKRPKPRLTLVEIGVTDSTGVVIVTAFRQPWLAEQLSAGMRVAIAGKIEFNYGFKRMVNPQILPLEGSDAPAHGLVIPVHPAGEKVTPALMRRFVGNALELAEGVLDPMPLELRVKYRLVSRQVAFRAIHFPESLAEAHEARRRLAYEEVLLLELHLMQQGAVRSRGHVPTAHEIAGPRMQALDAAIPFTLTDEQQQARLDILGEMAQPHAMNRMLLGDVGTGKTVVAAVAIAAAADTGGQALRRAPTEVLAQQHERSLGKLFDAAGITHAVLTGSTSESERAELLSRLAAGGLDVLIGTHALLEDDVRPSNLTLAVIDEQQRFGVAQRAKLLAKGDAPDALFLTATPIPRTLALALFGNLTLTYLKHRPHDAARRTTRVLAKSERGYAYDAAREALGRGEQVYVVCPLVGKDTQERDAMAGEGAAASREEPDGGAYHPTVAIEDDADLEHDDVAAATREAEMLQGSTFFDWRVELLHGGLPSSEKQQVMQRFHDNETQVLVATTVIEVGVDVPNATIMIVEDADRFGLSQLHQLRGRVGRGEKPAWVFLVSASKQDVALERLRAMETCDDGFELARIDLSLRREGDILGNRQSGASVLKLVNVVRDGGLIEAAHADARELLENDPDLDAPDHAALGREVRLLLGATRAGEGG